MIRLLILAILTIYPVMLPGRRECIQERTEPIAQAVEAAQRENNVPPSVLIAAAFSETHLGCDPLSGGNWGAPISASRRHTAGGPVEAARSLQEGFLACGSWQGAISRFRSGSCRLPTTDPRSSYVGRVLRDVIRLCSQTGINLPENFLSHENIFRRHV